jgi:hypothetical protein
MSMKSMTMIPPRSRSLLGGLQVGAGDRVLQPGGLPAAGERSAVDVDDGQRLGVVDHQVAAAGQVDPPRQRALQHLLHAVALEQRLVAGVELDALHQLGRGPGEERHQPVVGVLVVDDRALELGGEDVADHAHRQVGLLEDHRRRLGLLHPLLQHLVELVEVAQLALEVDPLGALGGGAHDHAAARDVELGHLLAQARPLLVVEPARHADPLARGREHHVAAGDGQLHRQARPLGLQRVLDDLDDQLLAGLDQVGDAAAVAAPATAPRRLHAGQHDLVDVQEAVLLQPDVDERRLQAGEDVVHAALVDVADDRAGATALQVQLGDAVAGRRILAAPDGGLAGRLSGRLHQRDPGLAPVDADQHLLSHVVVSPRWSEREPCLSPPPAPERGWTGGCRRPSASRSPRIPRSS